MRNLMSDGLRGAEGRPNMRMFVEQVENRLCSVNTIQGLSCHIYPIPRDICTVCHPKVGLCSSWINALEDRADHESLNGQSYP